MRFFGLLDHELSEVVEFYATLGDASRELDEMIHDEPGWERRYEIVLVDFAGPEVVVLSVRQPPPRSSAGR